MLEVWTDALVKIVPEVLLEDSYRRAVEENQSNFAPNAFDLLKAFREIEAERKAERDRARIEDFARNVETVNSPHFRPCDVCFGCGFREETRRFDGLDHKGAVKCYACNHWELYKQKHNL